MSYTMIFEYVMFYFQGICNLPRPWLPEKQRTVALAPHGLDPWEGSFESSVTYDDQDSASNGTSPLGNKEPRTFNQQRLSPPSAKTIQTTLQYSCLHSMIPRQREHYQYPYGSLAMMS
jgi:hypothetical protein